MEVSVSLDPSAGKDLEKYVEFLNTVEGVALHVDVMDGKFVERAAVTMEEYSFAIKETSHQIDLHLMIDDVQNNINRYIAKAVWGSLRSVTFHVESFSGDKAKEDILALLAKIKTMDIQAGIAIDLPTAVKDIDKDILQACDVVLVMSVKCGASGRPFDEVALEKVKGLKMNYPNFRVIIDGGVQSGNLEKVKKAGVDTAVVGSFIYGAKDRAATIKSLVK